MANHAQRAATVYRLLCEHTQPLGTTSTVLGVLFIAVGSASQRVTCDVMILHATVTKKVPCYRWGTNYLGHGIVMCGLLPSLLAVAVVWGTHSDSTDHAQRSRLHAGHDQRIMSCPWAFVKSANRACLEHPFLGLWYDVRSALRWFGLGSH